MMALLMGRYGSLAIGVMLLLAAIGTAGLRGYHLGYASGYGSEHTHLLEVQASAAAAVAERIAQNEQAQAQAQAVTKEVSRAYESRLSDLSARYDRLRHSAQAASAVSGGAVSAVAPAPGGPDATPAAPGEDLPRCVAADRRAELVNVLESADDCAVRLNALQRWLENIR